MSSDIDLKAILRKFLKNNNLNSKLGELTDLSEIGEGGNGLVFSGKLHNVPIAIKFLVNPTKHKVQRFKAEFLNVLLLPANNYVVKLLAYDEFEIEGQLFIAIIMRKYERSLGRRDSPTLENLKSLFKFLINAIGFIHENGIIHRDLKPDNILISKNKAVISDFGIASYNPKICALRAKTKKNERIANRLFSAPEQEEPNTPAHQTMDIFALGQILFWYVTGKVHRGTDRINISTIIPNSEFYDAIIEKCLASDPERRFQSIKEIVDFINKNNDKVKKREEYYYDDPYKYFYPFDEALSASFPKEGTIIYTEDKSKINLLFKNISEKCKFEYQLQYEDSGGGNMHINFTQLDDDRWLIGLEGHGEEIQIKSVWINHDSSLHAQFILINCAAMNPFGVYETDTLEEYNNYREKSSTEGSNISSRRLFLATEEACLVDDEFYITRREFDNGYAEINSEIIDLSGHKKNVRTRTLEEKTLIVATSFHSILQPENEKTLLAYLVKYNGGYGINNENFNEFVWDIRKHQHYLVLANM